MNTKPIKNVEHTTITPTTNWTIRINETSIRARMEVNMFEIVVNDGAQAGATTRERIRIGTETGADDEQTLD
jgi:hypothetical protein